MSLGILYRLKVIANKNKTQTYKIRPTKHIIWKAMETNRYVKIKENNNIIILSIRTNLPSAWSNKLFEYLYILIPLYIDNLLFQNYSI